MLYKKNNIIINKNNPFYKMMRFYIYKILYNNYNIERINKIKIFIIESALILQKYDSENSNQENYISESFIEDLNKNFEEIYDLIQEGKGEKADNKFYDKLRYILFKEIKKTSNANYRYQIFEKIIKEDQIIKKSNEIFQILLKNIFNKFEDASNILLNGTDEKSKQIVKLLEDKLNDDNNFILTETLLYFFEK